MAGPTSPARRASAGDSAALAPGWHTAVLVGLYVAVALTGLFVAHDRVASELPVASDRVVRVYGPMVAVQLLLVVYVSRVARPRGTLRALVGTAWTTRRRAVEDLAIALAGWIAITAFEIGWARFFPAWHASAPSVLPVGTNERLAWIVVSAIVGFGEEVVFRGYLRTQFATRLGDARLAIVFQAVLFGLAHAEQGLAVAVRNGLYGIGLGAIAQWRRSLIPCIACHAWTDLASGLWRI